MTHLKIQDLIYRLRTNDPRLVSFDSDSYSISSEDPIDNINIDISVLLNLLPLNTGIQVLRFEGPISSVLRRYVWQQLLEVLLCHTSIRNVYFLDNILNNIQITKVLANVIQYNPSVVITRLDLSRNDEMGVEGIITILDSLQYNRVLKFLKMENTLRCCQDCTIVDQNRVSRSFCDLLQNNTSIEYLGLNDNNLSATVFAGLAVGLQSNMTLDDINLDNNNIQKYGAIELSIALRYNQRLRELCLVNNNIGDDGAIAIAESLRYYNKSIKRIIMFDNNLTVVGYTALANVLKTNTSLEDYGIGGGEYIDYGQPMANVLHIIPFVQALQYNTTLRIIQIDPPESSVEIEIIKNKIMEMLEYNDTIGSFWMDWNQSRRFNNDRVLIEQQESQRTAPKKGGRQRSDLYHWLFQVWM